MNQKQFVLQNKGMNRDLSISKVGESTAYENRNIRILARDNDTLLSVTNERGTQEIPLVDGNGNRLIGAYEELVGWNVLNGHILLFTHDTRYVAPEPEPGVDPVPGYDTITYKYKIITTLNKESIDASQGQTATATAVRQKMQYTNGVPTSGWVYDADVTNLGFWAPTGAEHIAISGNTISGLSASGLQGVTIQSRGYAFEYTNAPLIVTGSVEPVVTRQTQTRVWASSTEIRSSGSDNTTTLHAQLYEKYSNESNWNYVEDLPNSGFEIMSGGDCATLNGNVLTGAAPGNVTVKSTYSADYFETLTITVLQQEDDPGGGGGGGDHSHDPIFGIQLIMQEATWGRYGHSTANSAIDYKLRIYNTDISAHSISSVMVRLKMTDDDNPASVNHGQKIDYTLDTRVNTSGAMVSNIPAGGYKDVTGKITGGFTREEGKYYWLSAYYNEVPECDYIAVGEEPEPDEGLLLLALTDRSSSGSGGGDGDIIPDRIYRIDYDGTNFQMIRGVYTSDDREGIDFEYNKPLFEGNLGFDPKYPIESIVYEETDTIKKIYWVDGLHVLRFMSFAEKLVHKEVGEGSNVEEVYVMPWESPVIADGEVEIVTDNTYFDSNRIAGMGVNVDIKKDNSGNTRANGTVQYLLTYFNKHGQETSYIWVSDLVYLSPLERGGGADETNNNRITLTISGLDTSFDHFRIYSVFRSSLNGTAVAYLVAEQGTSDGEVTVVDDGAHLTVQDTTRLLYLGSQAVVANTLAYKDQTLFLGDLKSTGRINYDGLEQVIRDTMFKAAGTGEGRNWEAKDTCISFEYTNDTTGTYPTTNVVGLEDIPYTYEAGGYSYKSQLIYSSSKILTFKGGEKYRFALKFKMQDGSETDAFWIGDKENTKYPVVDSANNCIKRVVVVCNIPGAVIEFLKDPQNGKFSAVQLCIAEATYADRSVKAQGIVNPTMFNVWERFNQRNYAVPTWISRPRSIEMVNRHFAPVQNSTNSYGEIQCNYWPNTQSTPVPYFQYKNYGSGTQDYVETYSSTPTWDALMLVFTINHNVNVFTGGESYTVEARIIELDWRDNNYQTEAKNFLFFSGDFTDTDWEYFAGTPGDTRSGGYRYSKVDEAGNLLYSIKAHIVNVTGDSSYNASTAKANAWSAIEWELINSYHIPAAYVSPLDDEFDAWCGYVRSESAGTKRSFNAGVSSNVQGAGSLRWPDVKDAMNYYTGEPDNTDKTKRWIVSASASADVGNKTPAYNKKHLMFVDENIVTLDSPEISYETVAFDEAQLKFRIVGAAKLSSVVSDYTVDATQSSVPGVSLDTELFSGTTRDRNGNINGFTSWPLWKEYGLDLIDKYDKPEYADIDNRVTDYYTLGNNIIRYWLYLWQHSGTISGYNFGDPEQQEKVKNASVLHRKVVANLRYSYSTTYLATRPDVAAAGEADKVGVRLITELPGSYSIPVTSTLKEYYTGQVQMLLGMPGNMKYPIVYSDSRPEDTTKSIGAESVHAYLSSSAPVLLEYMSGAHALISLPTTVTPQTHSSLGSCTQRLLPYFYSASTSIPTGSGTTTGALIPWLDGDVEYSVNQTGISPSANHPNAEAILETDQYMFIGELYRDCGTGEDDSRYGGTSESAIKNNRFITAGPAYSIAEMSTSTGGRIYGNQGDTYFQRWDDLRIKPYSNDAENNVIDIVSAMLETHINLDGRTDKQRGIPQLASIDTTTFGQLNPAYSQQNNFSVRRDLDSDFNLDAYRSSITWTLQKSDMSDVDEWAHITLASTLKLDSDKGICRALRKFQNNLIAFQDTGISEILFNSRTQVTTTDGVPVEIANSGKVDGKRYITNKYGCLNKWSITEGKNGLYFVDNINKAFCTLAYSQYGRAGVNDLSTRLGFSNWFHTRNKITPWNPVEFNNFISFYDKVHSDVYLVKSPLDTVADDAHTLVYNELLSCFTSFYDYDAVPMMANVEDRFVSFKSKKLWLQNEGAYGDFFGTYKPFWVQYRVTPDPYGDKIWTNVEYRADFYRTLEGSRQVLYDSDFTDDQFAYQPNETFDFMRFWNEYQTTETDEAKYNLSPIKKFRIWRQAIPRAMKTDTNLYGLDRIRNPWLNLLFKKNAPTATTSQDLMQLHDIIVTYYE